MTFRDARSHLRDIAARSVAAEESFVATLMHLGGITKAEAWKVFELYKKMKLVKRDIVNARYNVKHGGFLDREVIRRALEQAR